MPEYDKHCIPLIKRNENSALFGKLSIRQITIKVRII